MTMTTNGLYLPKMELDELFHLPEKCRIAAFAGAQLLLYRHNPCLHDYFLPLQLYFGRPGAANIPQQSFSRRALSLASRQAHAVIRPLSRRKYKADVLYCPMPNFQRRKENRFLIRTLLGLAQTDATILCLLPQDAPCREEIMALLKAEGRCGQVTLLDPEALLTPISTRLFSFAAHVRGRSAFAEISQILQPFGCNPPREAQSSFEHLARFVEAWTSIEEFVEFDAVVSRCHWQALCSPVCRTAQRRGKPIITFQQGVIDHTLDVPVIASRYVAFGRSSATFLERMNRSFFKALGSVEPSVDFVPGGSLYDTVLELPNQFEKRTLLLIDEPDPNGFYGLDIQGRGVLRLAEKLLHSKVPRHVIIRPHPYMTDVDLEPWKQLVRDYPDLCELSHSTWTIEDDLKRVSAVVGNFSGTLTLAAASGLPTFFLRADGYEIGDLACFRRGQTFQPEDAFPEISRVLTDPDAYAEARAVALANAREYYAEGRNMDLNGAFFSRMLSRGPVSASILLN